MKLKGLLIVLLAGVLLSACKPSPSKLPTACDQIESTLNESIQTDKNIANPKKVRHHYTVKQELMPPLSLQIPNMPQAKERRFNVAVKDMPAREFFMGLVVGTKYNMMVDPDVTGNVTLKLKNVTLEETLDAARKLYGYQYSETPYGYEILSPKMVTQTFSINYLNIQRAGQSRTQLTSTEITDVINGSNGSNGGGTPNISQPSQPLQSGTSSVGQNQQQQSNYSTGSGSTVITKSEDDFWKSLKDSLTTLLNDKKGEWVIVNPQASVVMVHAYPREVHRISRYLDIIQNHLQRQVTIEAKILEVDLTDRYQAGINWRIFNTQQTGATNAQDLEQDFGTGIFSFVVNGPTVGDFATMINLLEQQGNLQILSSPHLSTINNQEAVIKVGNDSFYVTGYTSNLVPSGTSTSTSQSVALTPFFSGITLDVTPQIGNHNDVTLYIHPSISQVTQQNKVIQIASASSDTNNNLTLPLAYSTIRESDNVVHAKNGQIVVIGGLMQTVTQEQIAATPWLSKIPYAGAIGRNTNQLSNKIELVILLKATVSSDKGWTKQLKTARHRFTGMNRGYHYGSLTNDFGTMAEANP